MINYRKGWKSFDDICGIENPGLSKIVGGHETAENQWPWQVGQQLADFLWEILI